MARDIRIHPKLGSTASNDNPRIDFGGLSQSTISLKVEDDGSIIYTGTYGVLFNISDDKDGLLHSVNDISGLPILSVYSNDFVQMGKWDKYSLVVNSDKVGVGLTAPSTKFHVYATQSGVFRLQDTTQVSGYVLRSDSNGVGTWQPESVTGSGTSNYLTRWITSTQIATSSVYQNGSQIGIGLTSTSGLLHLKSPTGSVGTTLLKMQGNVGDLLTINDSLTGVLLGVNDISGLPILEVNSDDTILMGNYNARSLYTTKKVTVNSGTTDIYSIATASYSGSFYDYTISDGTNSRAGNITSTWLGSSIEYNEVTTLDIGTTSNFTFSVVLSGTYSVLRSSASTNGWIVKTIIRGI